MVERVRHARDTVQQDQRLLAARSPLEIMDAQAIDRDKAIDGLRVRHSDRKPNCDHDNLQCSFESRKQSTAPRPSPRAARPLHRLIDILLHLLHRFLAVLDFPLLDGGAGHRGGGGFDAARGEHRDRENKDERFHGLSPVLHFVFLRNSPIPIPAFPLKGKVKMALLILPFRA